MVSRAAKLRFRRRIRLKRRQVEAIGVQAEEHLERNFFRRLEHLQDVRRFIVAWLLLLVLLAGCITVQMRALSGYYEVLQPVAGGSYNEGIVGSLTNANPIYATSSADQAVSRLIFAGLYSYNQNNQLTGDLAAGPAETNISGTEYTVRLRPSLTWQDGEALTAQDVVFTYGVIQNPDARSPLNGSWQNIKVEAIDDLTVKFTLPSPLGSFPHALTTGIIPEHILADTAMTNMRSSPFNTTEPIGAGPFRMQAIEVVGKTAQDRRERIALQPFDNYHAGKPKLNQFVVHTFRTQDDMLASFRDKQINAMAGVESLPDDIKNESNIREYSPILTAAVMTFFRTAEGVLSEAAVRQALVLGANTSSIIGDLGYATRPVREPFLIGQVGYDPNYQQPGFDPVSAAAKLDAAGWAMGSNGVRQKGDKELTFRLYAENTSEYARVAKSLQQQWKQLGVKVELVLQDSNNFQSTLTFHGYDALLYGISIGPDPDVYAYWSSTQADIRSENRLNFSEYRSTVADDALAQGRTRLDPALRTAKYKPFLQAWLNDAPALGLYQPRLFYVSRGPVFGINEQFMNSAADRFDNVNEWMMRQALTPQAKANNPELVE